MNSDASSCYFLATKAWHNPACEGINNFETVLAMNSALQHSHTVHEVGQGSYGHNEVAPFALLDDAEAKTSERACHETVAK